MVTGVCRHQDMSHYVRYLQHLWNETPMSQDPMSKYAKGLVFQYAHVIISLEI